MIDMRQRLFIDKELAALKTLTREKERGDLVKHVEIQNATGLTRDVAPWGKLIRQWKNWCMDELRISVCAVAGVGYRLNTEQDQLAHSLRLEKQGVKRTIKAGLIAGVLPNESLDESTLAVQQSIVARALTARTQFNEVIAERRSLLSKQESLPRLELSGVR